MSVVLWGPGEETLARRGRRGRGRRRAAVAADDDRRPGRAGARRGGDGVGRHRTRRTSRRRVGTPIVGIYGPTRPSRNGPLSPDDVTVSRDAICQCHHLRRCRLEPMCLLDIEVAEVRRRGRAAAVPPGARVSERCRGVWSRGSRVCGSRWGSCSARWCSCWRARRQATRRRRHDAGGVRRGDSLLGGRPSAQVARSHRVRAVSLDGAPALRRVVGHGRRPRDRVRQRRRWRFSIARLSGRPR